MAEVIVRTGISEADQYDSFQNATLQGIRGGLAMSLALAVDIPTDIAGDGQKAVAGYLRGLFRGMPECVHIEAEIGEADE